MKYNEPDAVILNDGRKGQLTGVINEELFMFTYKSDEGNWVDIKVELSDISGKIDRELLQD